MATRVVLVDDHELVHDGLRTLFAQDEEFEVVGEAGDTRTAVELAAARTSWSWTYTRTPTTTVQIGFSL